MAPAGLLFLLMMSSSLLLFSLGDPSLSSQPGAHSLQKRGKRTENFFTAVAYIDKVGTALNPFIGLIPVAGPLINGFVSIAKGISTAKTGGDTMNLIKKEFQNLNVKLDVQHQEIKWEIGTNTYQKYEAKIRVAWKDFEKLLDKLDKNPGKTEEWKNAMNTFKKAHEDIAKKTKVFLQLITKKNGQVSFRSDFGILLSNHVRCHEKNIKEFTLLIYTLIYEANVVSHFIDIQNNNNEVEQLAENAYDSALLMFDIHKNCISNPDDYIKQDIQQQMGEDKDRKQLAKTIRMFLEDKFDRYNWIVVAFLTENSNHEGMLKPLNFHFLSKTFIELTKGDVTVAAARQVKGTHTKAKKVTEAMEKCFAKKTPTCDEVIEQLSNCKERVDKIPLKETYSAVHAFRGKKAGSLDAKDAKEAPEHSDNPSETPYVYEAKCEKYSLFSDGGFRVLIKSDEEMLKTSPCTKMNCGGKGKGKCVLLENTFIAVCECEKGHYGQNCEETIEDYRECMNAEMPKN